MAATVLSPLTKSMFIATSAISAQNQRVLLITQNIANANVKAAPGEQVYQRQLATFESAWNPQVKANLLRVKGILKSKEPSLKTYSPGDPMADKDGFIHQPNISTILEMADMREAGRSHEAALRAFERVLGMFETLAGLLK